MKLLLMTLLLTFPALAHAQANEWWKMPPDKRVPSTASDKHPESRAVETPTEIQERIKAFRNSERFSVQYDKFRDESRVAVGPFDISDLLRGARIYSLKMTARFIYDGQRLNGSAEDFALLFSSRSKEWKFLKNRELYMLIDGERISIGEAEHDGDVELRSGVSEFMFFPISSEVFKRLASARQVEFKIGRWAVMLKDEHLEAFRDLYSLSQ